MTDVLTTLGKLPTMCATYLYDGTQPIMIRRGVTGYWPMRLDFDVEGFNRRHGVTPAQVQAMEIGSIFGWDVPGADPDHEINKGGDA
jgi:hypothetical protein